MCAQKIFGVEQLMKEVVCCSGKEEAEARKEALAAGKDPTGTGEGRGKGKSDVQLDSILPPEENAWGTVRFLQMAPCAVEYRL